MATSNGEVYLVGGVDTKKYNSTYNVYRLNLKKKELEYVNSLNTARHDFGLTVFKGSLVVTGGANDGGYLKSTEQCVFGRNGTLEEWKKMGDLNECSYKPGLVNFKDKYLFKLGGLKLLKKLSSSVEVYDMYKKSWNLIHIPNLSLPVGPSAVRINDYDILIVGGKNNIGQPSQSVFRMRVEEGPSLEVNVIYLSKKLDTNGEIYETPIVQTNALYFVENVNSKETGKGEQTYSKTDSKSVVCYNKNGWKVLM